jgi:hypothetical protein
MVGFLDVVVTIVITPIAYIFERCLAATAQSDAMRPLSPLVHEKPERIHRPTWQSIWNETAAAAEAAGDAAEHDPS